MLVLNEEEFVEDSINAARPYVDSILVIDQESTDRTPQIVKGMKGVQYLWHRGNFKSHTEKYFRDLAANLCATDWIMPIDADEIMSDRWGEVIRPMIDEQGDSAGAISVRYFNMMGSYQFQGLESPIRWPRFVRNHRGLAGCMCPVSMEAHSYYHDTFDPKTVIETDEVSIFHTGYLKTDLYARWERCIRRGDHGTDKAWQDAHLWQLKSRPADGFGQAKPLKLPDAAYPTVLRPKLHKWVCDFDPETNRITRREALTVC